jgi:hypothetical protein
MDDGTLVAIETSNFKIIATKSKAHSGEGISNLQLNAQALEMVTSAHDGKLCVWNLRGVLSNGSFELLHEVD